MTLLSQEVSKRIPSKTNFIDSCGDISEPSLGSDVIEIGRKKTGQLLGKVINRVNVAVQKPGDIPGKQICIFNENPA
jgi:hypothetical protein